ncbi:Hsp20 family protein [Caulobacter hibisci]|nr:Hsp20 family protein [Caulobacter hibisci]
MSTAFDFKPFYSSMIGVDRMVGLFETALRTEASGSFPPYDIERTDEAAYRISLAVAGFAPTDLEIVAEPNLLVIRGRKAAGEDAGARTFLHQGLAQRAFERRFELADYVVVKDAVHAHGVLSIDLVRELPDALKPKQIPIGLGASQQVLELRGPKAREAA